MSILNTLKKDSKEAAGRVLGTQIVKASKNGLLQMLRKRGINDRRVEAVSNFLDTEIGTAALSTVVGLGLSHLPTFKDNERAQSIAKEFRVGGMAVVGNLLTDKVVSELLPSFSNLLEMLPVAKPKIRVAVPRETPLLEECVENTEGCRLVARSNSPI